MKSPALLVLVAVLVAACAKPKLKEGELPDPPQRLYQRGLSFLPPAEKDWWIAQKRDDSLVIARLGKVEGDTHAIEASLIRLPAFGSSFERHQFVKASREKAVPAPRFRIRAHELSDQLVDTTTCTVSYLLLEDRQPDTGTNTIGAVLVESVSLVCAHPRNSSAGTMLTYTHRSYPEDQDRAFRARAGAVLGTFQFDEL